MWKGGKSTVLLGIGSVKGRVGEWEELEVWLEWGAVGERER